MPNRSHFEALVRIAVGAAIHTDNESVFRERVYLGKADPNLTQNEITTIDQALTCPWTVMRSDRRVKTGLSAPENVPIRPAVTSEDGSR